MKHEGFTPGPWIAVNEGTLIIKRQIFDGDDNPNGYELLDGDYDAIADLILAGRRAPRLAEENEKLRGLLLRTLPYVEILGQDHEPDLIAEVRAALSETKG